MIELEEDNTPLSSAPAEPVDRPAGVLPPTGHAFTAYREWRGDALLAREVESMIEAAFLGGWAARALHESAPRPPTGTQQLRAARERGGFKRLEGLGEPEPL